MGHIVILGGSGTIGLRLCSEFNRVSKEVIGTWHTRPPLVEDTARLKSVSWRQFPKSPIEWESLIGGADVVFHLANELWNYSKIVVDPKGPETREPQKNQDILQSCLDYRAKKLVWLSSSLGYGEGHSKEEENFFSGASHGPYESLISCIRAYETELTRGYPSLDVRIFRPTTVLGPPAQRPSNLSHVVVRILENLISRGSATIYTPDPQRNYIFSDDIAQLFRDEASLVPEPGEAEAYNLRGGSNWSLSQFAEEATSQLGLDLRVVNVIAGNQNPTVIDLPDQKLSRRHKVGSTDLGRMVAVMIRRIKFVLSSEQRGLD